MCFLGDDEYVNGGILGSGYKSELSITMDFLE